MCQPREKTSPIYFRLIIPTLNSGGICEESEFEVCILPLILVFSASSASLKPDCTWEVLWKAGAGDMAYVHRELFS